MSYIVHNLNKKKEVVVSKTKFKVISPDLGGFYTYAVQNLNPIDASRWAARGYTVIPATTDEPLQKPIRIATKTTTRQAVLRPRESRKHAYTRKNIVKTQLDTVSPDIVPKSDYYPRSVKA